MELLVPWSRGIREEVKQIYNLLEEYESKIASYAKDGYKFSEVFVGAYYASFKVYCFYNAEFNALFSNLCTSSWSLEDVVKKETQQNCTISAEYKWKPDNNEIRRIMISATEFSSYQPVINTLKMAIRRIPIDFNKYEVDDEDEDDD